MNAKGLLVTFLVGGVLFYMFHNKIKKYVPLPEFQGNYTRRADEANSFWHDLGLNPYYMKYGPYGEYYGAGYDKYLANPSPK